MADLVVVVWRGWETLNFEKFSKFPSPQLEDYELDSLTCRAGGRAWVSLTPSGTRTARNRHLVPSLDAEALARRPN